MNARPLPRFAAALLLAMPLATAQVIPNPSFEVDTFTVFPGYAGFNGGITDWTVASGGLNPASDNPFADNGVVPDGTNVAFIQSSSSSDERLSTTITGLTTGVLYEVSFRANSRAGTSAPDTSWSLDGGPFVPFTCSPAVGVGAPYYTIIGSFTASATTAGLELRNQTVDDSTVLLDDFRIVAKRAPDSTWTVNRWGDDASTSISTTHTQWAHSFGSSSATTINGVTVGGVATATPAVAGQFSVTGTNLVFPADTNQITALTGTGSAAMATDFIYNGSPTTITLQGLTAGDGYRVSLYGVGFDSGTPRPQSFASGSDQRVIDEEAFGENNGVRVDYAFVADDVQRTITITAINPGSTFHLYGLALHDYSSVTTLPAYVDAVGGATLHGTANPAGLACSAWFEWGDTTAPFSQQTAPQDVGSGSTALPFSAAITGLTPGVIYEGRPVLSNSQGIIYGEPVSFRSGVTTTVTNTDDGGPGSLRQRIADTMTGDIINFDAALSGQTILLTSGVLEIDNGLTVDASALPGGLILDGNQSGRILMIAPEIHATFESLTLQNGVQETVGSPPTGPAIGGAIYNEGNLILNQVTLTNNKAFGSPVFEFYTFNNTPRPHPNEALGGAIYNTGVLTMNQVNLSNNSAIGSNSGPSLGFGSGFFGSTASGGAIYNLGTLNIHECLIESNLAKGGNIAGTDPSFPGFGGAAEGGGIFNAGTLIIEDSSVIRNTARHGISVNFPENQAMWAEGGGMYNAGSATVNQSTLAENLALAGGLSSESGGGNNSAASGGAIFNRFGGNLIVNQSTISANRVESSILESIAAANNITLEEFIALAVSQGIYPGIGGGIANQDDAEGFGTLSLFNTIVAGNEGQTSGGLLDLVVNPARYTDQGGNFVGGDPLLGDLGDNGGLTPTIVPLNGSPVIDAGLNSATSQFPLDQLGASRLVGSNVDIGAMEYAITILPVPSIVSFSDTVLSAEPITGLNTVQISVTVDTDGASATGYFEHGSTTAYGTTVNVGSFGSYTETFTFTTDIMLGTGIPYNWRFVLDTSVGTLTSANQLLYVPPSVTPGDLNGDGVVTAEELNMILGSVDGGLTTINSEGYYTLSQIQDLNVGTPLLGQISPGRFRLILGLQKSADLSTTPFADFSFSTPGSTLLVNPEGKVDFEFPATDKAAFFRINTD